MDKQIHHKEVVPIQTGNTIHRCVSYSTIGAVVHFSSRRKLVSFPDPTSSICLVILRASKGKEVSVTIADFQMLCGQRGIWYGFTPFLAVFQQYQRRGTPTRDITHCTQVGIKLRQRHEQ